MKKAVFIGLVALCATACATMETPPLDDSYYWNENQGTTTTNVVIDESENI